MKQEIWLTAERSYLIDIGQDALQSFRYEPGRLALQTGLLDAASHQDISLGRHWHPEVEMVWVKAGTLRYSVNDAEYRLSPGEGLVIAPEQLHEPMPELPCQYGVVVIHPDIWCGSSELRTDSFSRIAADCLTLRTDVDWHQAIAAAIVEIVALNTDRTPGYELFIKSELYRILAQLYSHPTGMERSHGNEFHLATIKAMLSHIQDHYADKVTLNTIAQAGSVSRSNCIRLFRIYLRQTPGRYLLRYRLQQSIRLLLSGASITETALACGFSGASYYAEQFRAVYGCAPRDYRAARNR